MGNAIGGIIGGVLGGVASRKSSSGNTTTTSIQKADPWEGVQPYLRDLYSQASNVGTQQYYPGQLVANRSPFTNDAARMISTRAASGTDPTLAGATSQAQRTLRGDYLNSNPALPWLNRIGSGEMLNANPYVDDMFSKAAGSVSKQFRDTVMPGLTSNFALAGRYGSNAHQTAQSNAQETYGKTLDDLATNIYGGNYAAERALQQQALGEIGQNFGKERLLQTGMVGQAPNLQAAGYMPAQMLANVGASQDLYNQTKIDAEKARFDFGQNADRERLAFINSILSGAAPYASKTGTSSGNASQGGNPIMGALGGFGIGQAIQNAFPSGGGMGGGAVDMRAFENPGDIYGLFY